MDMMELFLGQIPEALYFSLFLIFAKQLENKRILFCIGMVLEYVLLLQVFPYTMLAHIFFFIMSYLLLKVLYRDRSQIIDIFILGVASIFLIAISFVVYILFWKICSNYIVANIVQKILLFIFLLIFKNKLKNLQVLYKLLWNRSKQKHLIKSATFRAINIVIFNLSFFAINLGLILSIILGRGV